MAPLKKRDKDANAATGIAAGSANLSQTQTTTTLAGQPQQQPAGGSVSSVLGNNNHNHNGTNGNMSNSNNNSMTNSNNNNNNNIMTNNNIESNNNTNGKDLNRRDSTVGAVATQRGNTTSCPDATTRFSSHPDTEIFLQAFEKPTQIYRFLRNRQVTNPLFLNRSLSYMRDRMSRSNKKRANFKASSMLQLVEQRISKPRSFLNIIYSGVYDESEACDRCYNTNDLVNIDANLVRIIRSKRKEGNAEIQEVFCETSQVTYNPKGPANRYGAVSLDMNTLCSSNEHVILKLLFSMKAVPKLEAQPAASAPAAASATDKKSPHSARSKQARKTRFLCSEMILVERSLNGLQEGEYETLLQEAKPTLHVGAKRRTWESMPKTFKPEWVQREAFGKFPALKFHVMWSSTKLPSSLTRDEYKRYTKCDPVEMEFDGEASGQVDGAASAPGADGGDVNHNNNNNNNSLTSTPAPSNVAELSVAPVAAAAEEPLKIVYNFMYNNNTNQKTEYTHELLCPWCSLDCMRLYPLLKHLKLCHPRFNFTYHPLADNTACIDVTINDTYDGSYAGSPYDLAGPAGSSFARTCGPVRRTTVTNLLVCRPRRQKSGLEEFMALDEDELNNQRPYITGHNRLYHHTETCLPVQTKELDIDSEGESDPLWLRQKTIQMIDEFSDVNEGEKELMKLWNLHVMKHGFVGDCQLKLACEMFLQKNGIDLIKKNLYRNFILHMCSLFDYGLVAQETLYMTVQKLQQLISKNPECQSLMVQQHQKQVKYWQEVGMHRQEELKLKSPQKVYTPAAATKRTKEAAAAAAAALSASPGGSEAAKSKSPVDVEAMQPPPKRSAGGAAAGNGAVEGRHSKAAKKVAAAEESQPLPKRVGRKSLGETLAARRSEAAAEEAKEKDSKRRSTGMLNAAATTEDGRRKRLKRQLSFPDLFSTMPASKRKRPDASANSGNNNNSSGSSSNTRASSQSNNNNNQTNQHSKADQNNGGGGGGGGSMMHASPTRPAVGSTFGSPGQQSKRGAPRRQSAAGQTEAKKFEGKTTASGHTLRARLSLEKR